VNKIKHRKARKEREGSYDVNKIRFLDIMSKISILGIEGTAWNLSAAIVDEDDVIAETTATYTPKTGGIHPREAAQHHANHITEVVRETLKKGKSEISAVI